MPPTHCPNPDCDGEMEQRPSVYTNPTTKFTIGDPSILIFKCKKCKRVAVEGL
jgi:hypothetical protein